MGWLQVDPDRQRLGVSMRPGAADFNVGDEVSKKMPFGLFVDIGACVDALLPAALLEKDMEEYAEGEALHWMVSQKGAGDEGSARISFKDLEERVSGMAPAGSWFLQQG
eukprot:Skav233259  [mRNA]  locus=scaffold2371:93162:94887:- [translate_table: standard]